MTARRAVAWVMALAIAVLIYLVSVIVTGLHTQNGGWLLVVVVFLLAAGDLVRQELGRGRHRGDR